MTQDSNKTSETDFWDWFERNEPRIFELETDQENILDEISYSLSAYTEGLAFEISPERDGKREFIISADGLVELFEAVTSLTTAAPEFERWSIVAFRPRMNDFADFTLNYGGKSIEPSKMWIYPHVGNDHFDLIIFHPNYTEQDRNLLISAAYILLDMAIGEYDVVTGIRGIDHQPLPRNPENKGLRPFSELRKIFDEYKSNLRTH